MRVLELPKGKTSAEWGEAHGETFRPLIEELSAIRTQLTIDVGGFPSEEAVLSIAERHLPILKNFDGALYDELVGIARGANLSPAQLVVVNHYTDLRDIDVNGLPNAESPGEDDCSVIFQKTAETTLLGQTWDMHGSATPYVMMLGVPESDAPACWSLTVVGCVGMTGFNSAGLGITINNLKSTDARVGVVWPALVRRALRERSAAAAKEVITSAPLGSGHHYFVADKSEGFGIETSGVLRKIVFEGGDSFYHTNHCVDAEVGACSLVNAESTTYERFDWLSQNLKSPVRDLGDMWTRLGSHDGYPRSLCTHLASPVAPHKADTCGGLAMDLGEKKAWATHGCMHSARPHTFGF